MEQEFSHGITCLMGNAFEDAANVFQELLQKDVHNPFILHNFGLAHECMGKIDEAIEIYERTVDMHPTHVLSYLCLSNCNLYKNKLHKAICWLKKAEELCPPTAQVQILMSEACFLAGNPREGCRRHQAALDLIDNLTLTTHHVQLYTDYGNGSLQFYSWIENSYISHGKAPTLEFFSQGENDIHTLVLVQPQDADGVKTQMDGMSQQQRSQLYVVSQSSIVERLLGDHSVDARVVHSAPCQNDLELMAYVLDISHAVLQATTIQKLRILLPGETDLLNGETITVDASVQATAICPMLLRGDSTSAARVYASLQ